MTQIWGGGFAVSGRPLCVACGLAAARAGERAAIYPRAVVIDEKNPSRPPVACYLCVHRCLSLSLSRALSLSLSLSLSCSLSLSLAFSLPLSLARSLFVPDSIV